MGGKDLGVLTMPDIAGDFNRRLASDPIINFEKRCERAEERGLTLAGYSSKGVIYKGIIDGKEVKRIIGYPHY